MCTAEAFFMICKSRVAVMEKYENTLFGADKCRLNLAEVAENESIFRNVS